MMEKVLLDAGVPFGEIKQMDMTMFQARYMVFCLPFLQKQSIL